MIAEVETGWGGNGTSVVGVGGGLCLTGGCGGSAVSLFGVLGGNGGDETPFEVTAVCGESHDGRRLA